MDNFDYKGYLKSRRLFEQEYDDDEWIEQLKNFNSDIFSDYLVDKKAKYIPFNSSLDVDVEEPSKNREIDYNEEYKWYRNDILKKFVDKYSDKGDFYFTFLEPEGSNFIKKYPEAWGGDYDYRKYLIFSNGNDLHMHPKKDDLEMIIGAGQLG